MVHNNKVLTVSYGTFSCTLEGFEDSFGTMKAIAEYFRDLASDDRYFGAEPPQPDAEMLARIAQREVARQVEAHTSSDGIHLRTTAATAAPQEAPSQPAIAPSPAAQTEPAAEPDQETATATDRPARLAQDTVDVAPSEIDLFEEDDTQPEPLGEASAPAVEDETPQQPTLRAEPQADPEDKPQASPAASVDLATIAAISAAVSEAPTAEAATIEDITPEEVAEKVHFFDEDMPAEPQVSARSNDTVPAADSIAAKLQRIRAVVSQPPEEEFSEDEHAEAFVETARAELAQVEEEDLEDIDAESDEISRVLDRLDLAGNRADAEPAAQQEVAAADPETAAASSETLIASVLQEPTADQAAAPAATEPKDAEEAPSRSKRGTIRLPRRRPPENEPLSTPGDSSPAAEPRLQQSPIAAEEDTAARPPAEDTAETAAPTAPKPQRARIVKVKRAQLEKAMASGNLEEVAETPTSAAPTDAAQETPPPVESSLDADEEADLLRELAEVEAELLASNQDAELPSEEQEEAEASKPQDMPQHTPQDAPEQTAATSREAASPQTTQSPDSDVSRLMEAAESKLGDPDNATSRETYSHLRAAVAAAEADRSAGDNSVKMDEAEPYREDLANVVRPRRPGAGDATKAPRPRNAGSRPAPLKLVAEQRIDPEVKSPATPVRPRRISMAVEETSPAQAEALGSFTDYAQDLGATELHELLEAAAAYLSFVEERDQFSRPQLMNKVRSVGHGDFNRENGLRFIGQLLREGKIERSDNGLFTATDDIGFRPRKRAAG